MNIPNLISLARLLIVPVVVWLILTQQLFSALILFCFAGISDALDGFIARAFKLKTIVGAYLDPIADKALLVGVYTALGQQGLIELWVVILVVFRDLIIIGGIILFSLLRRSIEMKPLIISKINTVVQILFAVFVLAKAESFLGNNQLNMYFGYLVAFTTVLSGASYVKLGLQRFNQSENPAL